MCDFLCFLFFSLCVPARSLMGAGSQHQSWDALQSEFSGTVIGDDDVTRFAG